jgi:hypothetical protein
VLFSIQIEELQLILYAHATMARRSFLPILTALESSPISEKFPPTNAPRTLYTVKKKIEKFSKLRLF